MKNIEHITRNGKPYVMMPLAAYETLLEDAEMQADVMAYDEAVRRLESGESELLPADLVDALCEAKHNGQRLKLWREHRGLTQSALAKAAGVSNAYLSEVEAGKKPGSAKALKALAEALSCDVDDLIV